MPAIISVDHLSKKFNNILAVDGLSFTVNAGDVYGFLGQNGAGKSTTIRMLLTLIRPTEGEISIFGKNLNTHRGEILSRVGAVIEKPDLYKYLSAYENLSLFARMSGKRISKKQLTDQLEMVGLGDRACDKVKTFSQGMKQRLGIAVALVHDPRLIILDEPTNGLDPQGIADMRNLILHLSGNLRQWIVAGIGGAADVRNRPAEFSQRDGIAKVVLLAGLENAVDEGKAALRRLTAGELLRVRRIQGYDVSALAAILRRCRSYFSMTNSIQRLVNSSTCDRSGQSSETMTYSEFFKTSAFIRSRSASAERGNFWSSPRLSSNSGDLIIARTD